MEEKVTTFDSFIENLCKQYKDNEKKMRELILSIRKFKLLQKYGYIRLFSPMDSDDVLAAGLKDFEFGLYPRRDRSLHFNGDDYFFRQLYSLRVNKPCRSYTYGADIEYRIGSTEVTRRFAQYLRNYFQNSSTDHGNEVLENRPVATNNIKTLFAHIESYYSKLSQSVDLFNNKDVAAIAFGTPAPKISFDKYDIGFHLHLHLRNKFHKPGIIRWLDILSVWFNSKNKPLWKMRLGDGYGKPFFSSAVRDADWQCSKSNHACLEYRAFNSAPPGEIRVLLDAIHIIVSDNSLKCPLKLYTQYKKMFSVECMSSEFIDNLELTPIENCLKKLNIVSQKKEGIYYVRNSVEI